MTKKYGALAKRAIAYIWFQFLT